MTDYRATPGPDAPRGASYRPDPALQPDTTYVNQSGSGTLSTGSVIAIVAAIIVVRLMFHLQVRAKVGDIVGACPFDGLRALSWPKHGTDRAREVAASSDPTFDSAS